MTAIHESNTVRQRHRRRTRILAAVALAAGTVTCGGATAPAHATTPGFLDPDYPVITWTPTTTVPASGGQTVHGNVSHASAILDPQGRTVVMAQTDGSQHLLRWTADGTPDTSFGDHGSVDACPEYGYQEFFCRALLADTDGRIYVGGRRAGSQGRVIVFVRRYLATGAPDTTFGTDGLLDLPARKDRSLGEPEITEIVTRADGSLLLVRERTSASLLNSITSSGAVDTTFRFPHGDTSLALGEGAIRSSQVVGHIAIALGDDIVASTAYGLTRFDRTGNPVTSFGYQGLAELPSSLTAPIAAGPSGTILVSGRYGSASPPLLARITTNGKLDTSVGDGGINKGGLPLPGNWRVLLTLVDSRHIWQVTRVGEASPVSVYRWNLDLTPDTTFGTGGRLVGLPSSNGTMFLTAFTCNGGLIAVAPDSDAIRLRIHRITGGASTVPAGGFLPLPHTRLLDTRLVAGQTAGRPVPANSGLKVTLGGRALIDPNAGAVVLHVTAVSPAATGYLTLYPGDAARPGTSTVNFVKGATSVNAATVRLGSDGSVVVHNGSAGSVHVLLDVEGYYRGGEHAVAGSFTGFTPYRVLDTRTKLGGSTRMRRMSMLRVTTARPGGVPSGNVASAVVVNLTATRGSGTGDLSIRPAGSTDDGLKAVPFTTGTAAVTVTVPVGPDGTFEVVNGSENAVDLIVDVAGYYRSGTPTRPGTFVPALMTLTDLNGNERSYLDTNGGASVAWELARPRAAAGPISVIMWATSGNERGYVTVYGDSPEQSAPGTSVVNLVPGTAAVSTIVDRTRSGLVMYHSGAGTIAAGLRATGWFLP